MNGWKRKKKMTLSKDRANNKRAPLMFKTQRALKPFHQNPINWDAAILASLLNARFFYPSFMLHLREQRKERKRLYWLCEGNIWFALSRIITNKYNEVPRN